MVPDDIEEQYKSSAEKLTGADRKYLLAHLDYSNGLSPQDIAVKHGWYRNGWNKETGPGAISTYAKRGQEIAVCNGLPSLEKYLQQRGRGWVVKIKR